MTTEFKMPEPYAFSLFDFEGGEDLFLRSNNEEMYEAQVAANPQAVDDLYTSSDMRAVIEQCAAECEQAKDLYDASTLYDHVPGILQIRADRIRELLEKVK